MFRLWRKLITAGLCALVMASVGAAPVHAEPKVVFTGRAGEILNLKTTGDTAAAAKIAAEFVGLIHVLTIDETERKQFLSLQTRDGEETLLTAESVQVEDEELLRYSEGEITSGALQGAKMKALVARNIETLVVEMEVALGGANLSFTQVVKSLEGMD